MTTEERIEATLASGVEPGQSAREYLAFAAAQRAAMGLEDVSGLGKALDEALAAVERYRRAGDEAVAEVGDASERAVGPFRHLLRRHECRPELLGLEAHLPDLRRLGLAAHLELLLRSAR